MFKLVLGLECGGSHDFSEFLQSRPLGLAFDLIVALGGATVFRIFRTQWRGTELINRCEAPEKQKSLPVL